MLAWIDNLQILQSPGQCRWKHNDVGQQQHNGTGPNLCSATHTKFKVKAKCEKNICEIGAPENSVSMRSVLAARLLRSDRFWTSSVSADSMRWNAKPTCGVVVTNSVWVTLYGLLP